MFRDAEPIDFFDKAHLKPTEKLRYHNHRSVIVDMGETYEKRLQELREKSKELNKLLQKKIDEQGLPFSTRRSHSKIMRFNVQLRPPFFQSNLSQEEKAKMRYSEGLDSTTAFLHLNESNRLERDPRFYVTDQFITYSLMFSQDARNTKGHALREIDAFNIEELVDSIVEILNKNSNVATLKKAFEIKTIEQAQKYFQDNKSFLSMIKSPIYSNIIRAVLNSILSRKIEQLPRNTPLEAVNNEIFDIIMNFSKIEIHFSHQQTSVFNILVTEVEQRRNAEAENETDKNIGQPKKNTPTRVVDDYFLSLAKEYTTKFKTKLSAQKHPAVRNQ